MTDPRETDIAEIQATQEALRKSIEATKALAEKAETLLQKHKQALERAMAHDRMSSQKKP